MTTIQKRLRPILQAQKRRSTLPWYFELSGKGLFLLIVLAASLLALLALAQTGRVVSVAYRLKDLEHQEMQLLWEQETLLEQIAHELDPAALESWAQEHGMVPVEPEDITFLAVPDRTALQRGGTASMAEETWEP